MAISQDLLEILACPACKAKVELKPDGSGLKCVQCHRLYPIRDDIPVMLIDEATIEDEEPARNSRIVSRDALRRYAQSEARAGTSSVGAGALGLEPGRTERLLLPRRQRRCSVDGVS